MLKSRGSNAMLFVAIESNTNVSKQWIDPIFLPFRCGDDTHCPRPLGEERCLWDCCYNNLGNIVCDDDAKACFLALWDTLSIAVRAQHKRRTSNGSAHFRRLARTRKWLHTDLIFADDCYRQAKKNVGLEEIHLISPV